MKTALMVFASDLIDEGFEVVADVARDRGGFEAIELAAIYHHARDVHPHNPVHRVLFLDGGALFFAPILEHLAGSASSRTSPACSRRSIRYAACSRWAAHAISPCARGQSTCTTSLSASATPMPLSRMRSAITS